MIKTLDDFNLKGKKVLIRVDLNSAIINKKLVLSDKIIEHAKTIKELQRKKAKVVVLSHQGRPKDEDFTSLKQHSKLLNKYIKIKFVNDIMGKKAIKEIKKLQEGQAILLENVRFLKEEFKPSLNNKIVKNLSPLLDLFVLDAFSICHRNETSITCFAKILPSCAGRVLEKEILSLNKIKRINNPLYILAGAKISENFDLLQQALKKKEKVLVAGLLGQLCLIASGHNLCAQNKFLEKKGLIGFVPKLKNLIKQHPGKIEMPRDLTIKIKNKRKELLLKEFPSKYEIFDIGSKTIKEYKRIIKQAKTIFLKGPLGYYQDKKFRIGTKKILESIPTKSFSIIAGGDTTTALNLCKINKKRFNQVSLAGGALIEYIVGKKLPGLEVLKKRG